ncbi:leucine-rich repeats and immunoglobulin-like domains protein 3 [Lepisosteus oculatus]|uniref:leucine-rich repeats and immunoglobulin-like domains protein 3 n=1 Tax=Lepisosteus oculatus TaxID=7918 RepID=UPI00372269F9
MGCSPPGSPCARLLSSALTLLVCMALLGAEADTGPVYAQEGEAVNLTADAGAPGQHLGSVTWKVKKGTAQLRIADYNPRDDGPAPRQHTVSQYKERIRYADTFLWISNLSQQDTGLYIVQITDSGGNVKVKNFTLIVEVPVATPQLSCQSPNRTQDSSLEPDLTCRASEGGSLHISCSASRGTSPNISWYRDGRPLLHGQNLSIVGLDTSHCGVYTCVVSNAVSRKEAQFRLQEFPMCDKGSKKLIMLVSIPVAVLVLLIVSAKAIFFIKRRPVSHTDEKSTALQGESIYVPMYPSLRRPAKGPNQEAQTPNPSAEKLTGRTMTNTNRLEVPMD